MSEIDNNGVIHNKSRLTLEKRHQLIDLNKEYINFEIMFECRALDATKDFEMLVINQEQLNTIDLTNLVMKKTKGGYISGNIIADENKYQNYFLIVRSITDEPIEVDLDITIKPTEARSGNEEQQHTLPPTEDTTNSECFDSSSSALQTISSSKTPYHIIFIVIGLLVLGGAFYYYYKRKNKGGAICQDDNTYNVNDDAGSVSSSSSSASASSIEDQGILNTLINKSKNKTK